MSAGNAVIGVLADPYAVQEASLIDTDPSGTVVEIELTTALTTVDIGGGVLVNAETYNGTIPGPTLRLNVGDTVIVRLINDLPYPTAIHWHGIELQNSADGTPVTQDGARVGPFPAPSPVSPTGGTYLYRFKVTRPGLFWYHPHHFHSTNRVFRGLYGMIVVTDPNEAALITSGAIPGAADTLQFVLSDITRCKGPGSNDPATYVDPSTLPPTDAPEWASGANAQAGPTPVQLCEIGPGGQAIQEDGSSAAASYAAGDVPNIQKSNLTPPAFGKRTVEGQTVLTNGVNVGDRPGTPTAPGTLPATAFRKSVLRGQGVRLQIVNCAHLRYFRLRLMNSDGTVQVPLVRIGGEGGLLDRAREEGGSPGGFDTKFDAGEVLVPPSSRVDVVAAIPAGEPIGGILTLWTRDYQRTGGLNPGNWAQLPTVAVAHFEVVGTAPGPAYAITGGDGNATGTALRAAIPDLVPTLPAAGALLLDPSTFSPAKTGQTTDIQDIQLTAAGGVAGVNGTPGGFPGVPYTTVPKLTSTRYAEDGAVLEMTVSNTSGAHHPFHLHGFSFQPRRLEAGGVTVFLWPHHEFVDVVDIPAGHSLKFGVRLDSRTLADGTTLAGSFGRWLFHCHIFFHAHSGMISELIVTAADGSEKPNVDVGGSWAYAPIPGIATRRGTYSHPDGDPVTLTASLGTLTVSPGPTLPPGQSWTWELDSTGRVPSTQYVYITAEDSSGRKDQTVFRLKLGAPDDGSDNGDPHIHTVDGKRYDFQAVGEFVLLRDREAMEVQTRQTPVATQHPITDSYTGVTACVSVNTAVAARVGTHRVSYQPGREPGQLELYVDGKPADLSTRGINLDGHLVSPFDADGATGLRIDYAHHAVLTVTPRFWSSHNIWYMNVAVSHTLADEGLMGRIPEGTWLPKLPNGATVGAMPPDLHDRWVVLYRNFAAAWRVTDDTSLFVYHPGTSTETFTDRDWPPEKPPCTLKPELVIPGAPVLAGMPIADAERICQAVTIDGLRRDCVFDVATTGDETFARGYLFAQKLKLHGTAVKIAPSAGCPRPGDPPGVVAAVVPLGSGPPTPTGHVRFLADGAQAGPPVKLDATGRACLPAHRLEGGEHEIQAVYTGSDGDYVFHESASPILRYTGEGGVSTPEVAEIGKWPWVWILLSVLILIIALWWLFV